MKLTISVFSQYFTNLYCFCFFFFSFFVLILFPFFFIVPGQAINGLPDWDKTNNSIVLHVDDHGSLY